MALKSSIRYWGKRWLFPGVDLNTRCRYRFLPRFFRGGPVDTLDAGCGNGALAYAAYRLGNRVLGVNFELPQIENARWFFDKMGVERSRLELLHGNLYDLPALNRQFDQIICSETLEHIKRDQVVARHFFDCLRPGGVLHLCCPFAPHPMNAMGRVDGPEDGGHVRDGYTMESYRALLEPLGFRIEMSAGLGTDFLQVLDRPVRNTRNRFGNAASIPVFLFCAPLTLLDRLNPPVPFSLYVQAVKPGPAS
jgi:SAM-dependent methyltransferase